jgi:hypothetical protein
MPVGLWRAVAACCPEVAAFQAGVLCPAAEVVALLEA